MNTKSKAKIDLTNESANLQQGVVRVPPTLLRGRQPFEAIGRVLNGSVLLSTDPGKEWGDVTVIAQYAQDNSDLDVAVNEIGPGVLEVAPTFPETHEPLADGTKVYLHAEL